MEIRWKSLIGYCVLVLTALILQAAFIISYLRSEINHSFLESHCDDGWRPYKQEKCLKLFDTAGLLNYGKTELFCKEQNGSHLLSVDGDEKQEFVQTFLKSHSVVDNVWIGLKYVNDSFRWTDGTQTHYTNWEPGNPKKDAAYCVQMETEAANFGLWSDESCGEKNLVVCERFQHWSLAQLQIKMMDLIRNSVQQRSVYDAQFSSSTNSVQNLKLALTELKTSLTNTISSSTNSIHDLNSTLTQVQTSLKSSVSSLTNTDENMNSALTQLKTNLADSIFSSTNLIEHLKLILAQSQTSGMHTISIPLLPVGFIYVQLPKEKSPAEMWPWMIWKDISSEYAGLFFRTEGGNAAPFGETQNGDSPRLVSMKAGPNNNTQAEPEVMVLANNQYSPVLDIDSKHELTNYGFKVKVSNGEVRPVNMAIRIWSRIN